MKIVLLATLSVVQKAKQKIKYLIILVVFLAFSSSIGYIHKEYDKVLLKHTYTVALQYKVHPEEAFSIISTAKEAAEASGIPLRIILGIIATESSFRVSPNKTEGAKGLMQIHKSSGLMPIEPLDIEQNIYTGTSILVNMKKRYGNLDRAIEAYNAGYHKRNPEYVRRVKKNSEYFI